MSNPHDSLRTREFCGMTGGFSVDIINGNIEEKLEGVSEWIQDELNKIVVFRSSPS